MTGIYYLSDRMPIRYEWKLLFSLVNELKPLGLPQLIYDKVLRATENRDMRALKDIAEAFSPRCLRDELGYTVHSCALVYQVTSLIRKFQEIDPLHEEERKAQAKRTFFKAEEQCKLANERLPRELAFPESDIIVNCLTSAKKFIRKAIGDVVEMSDIYKGVRPGTGQSFSGPGRGKVTNFYKFSEPNHWTVTEAALPYVIDLVTTDDRLSEAYEYFYRTRYACTATSHKKAHSSTPVVKQVANAFSGPLKRDWLSSLFTVVSGNRVTTVPKDAFTERTIAIEPGWNLQLQLGVEDHIRRGLKRFGVDLDDQTKNQRLAKLASITSSHATIDLSSASDTISVELVKYLLPKEWWILIDDLRCHQGTYDSESVTYEKISSMGNGFTFALESLIFASLTFAAYETCGLNWQHDDFAVYGDDVVCRSETSLLITELFEYCGFSVNREKTFYFGSFRESCGADYIDGIDIRPVFHKSAIDYVDDLYVLHNQLYKWLYVHTYSQEQSETLELLKRWLPPQMKLFGPLTEETNTHLFSEKLQVNRHGNFTYRKILRKATVFKHNRYSEFYFRKLMARLPENDNEVDMCLEHRAPRPQLQRYVSRIGRNYLTSAKWLSYKDTHVCAIAGKLFDVTRRNAFCHYTKKTQLPSWQQSFPSSS